MVSCNCSFAEYTWVLHRSWVRMNTVEWNFTWIITSISVWTIIDYTTKKPSLIQQVAVILQFLVPVEHLTLHMRKKRTKSRSEQMR